MILGFEFRAKSFHVLVAEVYEMVKTFLRDRLDESFRECDRIRRKNRGSLRLASATFHRCKERFRVFAIIVMHQDLAW